MGQSLDYGEERVDEDLDVDAGINTSDAAIEQPPTITQLSINNDSKGHVDGPSDTLRNFESGVKTVRQSLWCM
jgi:hypothetical protein